MRRSSMMALLFAVLLIFMVACSEANVEAEEKIVLKFAASKPTTHQLYPQILKPFMDQVTELTDGQVEFEFYPSEQLGKVTDILDLTSTGVADIGVYYASYYPSKMTITDGLIGFPGIYTTSYEGTMTYHELSKKSPILDSDFLSNGVRPLYFLAVPTSELWTTGKEIKSLEDVKGMQIRTTGDLLNKATTSLGATAVNIAVPELYEGFERSVFDSISINPVTLVDYGLEELVKYGTDGIAFGGASFGFAINEKVFQGLPENVQDVIFQVADELTESTAKYYDEHRQEIIDNLKAEGVTIHELSEEEKAEWQKFYDKIGEKWVKEQNNPDLEKMIVAFEEGTEAYK